ncbi:MAG: hypothetical protein ACHQ1H_02585, partial [Nitrososphaerales archaeon]
SNGQSVLVPISITWVNESPITANLWLNASLTQIPGKPVGNYGFNSGPLRLAVGGNDETFLMRIPSSELANGSFQHGNYTFQIALSQSQSSPALAEITQSENV